LKFVIFDIGNVIAHVNFSVFVSSLCDNKIVKSCEEGYKLLEQIQPYQDLGLTNVKRELSRFNLDKKIESNILLHWMETVSFNQKSLNLINDLIIEKYNIALLSNIGPEHASIIRNNDLLKKLNHHFSFEIGARKPSKIYYQSFLMDNPLYKGCAFIDDRYENLEMAEKCGFKSYHFDLDKLTDEESMKNAFYDLNSFIRNV